MADTPMMQQYTRIKEQNADCILFFRLGDFYEMFGEDAAVAAKELDLVLTSRSKNVSEEDKVPMCGLPYHAADGYIARLLAKGYKVAICEQMEDPKLAKGLVERDIIRIITPGTAIESSMLDESRNNFIGALVLSAESAGLCFCDISTGEAYCTELTGADLEQQAANEFGRFSPSEALLNRAALESGKVTSFLQDRLGCAVESIQSDRSDRTEADDASRGGERFACTAVRREPSCGPFSRKQHHARMRGTAYISVRHTENRSRTYPHAQFLRIRPVYGAGLHRAP